ncbi:hypothetical protein Dda_7811 [Drechslerella dactyloides]|uniref:Phosphatidate phosphatase APP1 catalytic domain-containing protein n=1 Tax=Drechslerella dactyloides TaxID=74499 RepID=A0AAD6NHM8_DREDA|nr:hypothetical protein Dda_7811 [Drechslerella dactyloides]
MHIDWLATIVALAAIASPVLSIPVPENLPRGAPLITDNVLLFDAPAFMNANGEWTASFRMFSSLRQIDTKIISGPLTAAIEAFGVEVGNGAHNLLERTKLFLAISRSSITVDVKVAGCNTVSVGETSSGGLLEKSIGVGKCDGSFAPKSISGSVPRFFSSDAFEGTLFPSPPTGFGVISDVDDTIKVSNVLDKKAAIKALLIEDHKAVDGMPQLYSKLNGALNTPQWLYLTGSPYQFYPSLRQFIFETYPKGPIVTQNLTFSEPKALLAAIVNDSGVRDYKVAQMEKFVSYYPQKKFVMIGDSTQQDPEAYAEVARRHPDSIQCIWIRQVQNATNTPERFASAFKAVPQAKWKVFTNPAEVTNLDVANGKCN